MIADGIGRGEGRTRSRERIKDYSFSKRQYCLDDRAQERLRLKRGMRCDPPFGFWRRT